jgi:hypothetical protein
MTERSVKHILEKISNDVPNAVCSFDPATDTISIHFEWGNLSVQREKVEPFQLYKMVVNLTDNSSFIYPSPDELKR